MKEIKVKDINGKSFSGQWNGKTYTSKEGEGYVRIYIDSREIHVSEEEIQKVGADLEADRKRIKKEKLDNLIENILRYNEAEDIAYIVDGILNPRQADLADEVMDKFLKIKGFEKARDQYKLLDFAEKLYSEIERKKEKKGSDSHE